MATLSPATPRNVHDQSSTAPIEVNNPEDAFRELWSQALQKFEKSVAWNPSQWQSMVRRMGQCREAEDVCRILDGTMRSFESFRGSETTWGKLRNKYLKPAIEVLLLFNDAIAETAAFFPEVPGGKAIFAAFGVVLQTTKGVSAYCDALVVLFEELNLFLEALRPRLLAPSSLGPASKTIAIAILSHLLDVVVHVAKILSKGSWLGRLSLYGRVLVKDTTVQDALRRIRALTDLEVRAIVSEIRVDTSDIRTAASDMRDITRQTQKDVAHMQSTGIQTKEITTRLLSEFRALQQDQVKARGIIGRGMDRLIRGQKELIALLRAEREQRNKVDASRVFEKLARVERADIDAQNPEGCMKDTRVKILKDLRAWSQDNNAPRLYWLNGMAGTGKSAIARSFCHQLRRDRLLGGSFFCSRGGSVEEGDVQHIIPTLAASLATHSLSFNENLLAGLTEEPFSVHWNLALQIERLLQTPMSSYDGEADMLVLVIDALDECSDDESTRHLLSRLVRVSSVLPVKFFITSRPEPHIRSELESLDPSLGHVLRLHDIEQDIVRADISLYLVHGLRAMRGPTFPPKWPNKSDVTTLVRLSGKLFIYAFTALQYVRKDPLGRLPKLTGTKVTAGRPLTQPLDDIYSLILSEAMNPNEFEAEEIDLTRRIMAMIVA
ncbi:unnamed protein product [Peniophora sp. CBMAI 1063]|nr:unnamed protein product [Peniophora sp. CBMAI 1063]